MQLQEHVNHTKGGKLVDAVGLLEILFEEKNRPSLRWLRYQQDNLPHAKIGRLVFFDPEQVRAKLFPSN